MNRIRGFVVAALLAVWSFPAVSSARSLPSETAPAALSTPTSAGTSASGAKATDLAAREQQARNLQDFKGGGVSIYIGSGALFVLIIVLLIILL
jgi:hypothetical protein